MKRAILVMSAVLCSTADSTIAIGAPSGDTTLIGGRNTEIDPPIDSWTATTTTGAPSVRLRHTAVWTGSKMIVWGGYNGSYLTTGGQYDPVTNSWTPTQPAGTPSGRDSQTAVWTGSKMIVWGGFIDSARLNDGGQYDPVANAWTPTTRLGAPSGRSAHTAVWTGSRMIIWGGYNGSYLNDGGQYDPVANSWMATKTTGAPSARSAHTAVWTGSRMIIWSGYNGAYLKDGGRYDPVADAWTPTTGSGAPSGRSGHTAVWTGSTMIVWGGFIDSARLDSGGQYDPAVNAWAPTTRLGAPSVRFQHTAVWTGSRMIVWGGYNGGYLNDGGQYDPVANAWTTTTTTGAPSGRQAHTAVWTGSRMIIWGGGIGGSFLNDGGQWGAAPDLGCYSLTTGVSPGGSGTVSVNTGLNCSGGFTGGTNISLTANAQPGWAFSAWLGSGGNFSNTGANPTTFTITGNANVTALYVTALTAQFSAAYEDHSAIDTSNVTAYKNIVFTAHDQPSQVDSYSWDFGDGSAHGTGSTATHSFAPGSWTVKLTVTKGSASGSTSLNLTALSPSEPPKWFVAGLAYTQGAAAGTVWQSDMTILNPHPTLSARYSVAFLDGKNPVAPKDLVWRSFILPAQQNRSWSNVLADLFGQSLGSYGAVIVRGDDVEPVAPSITSRTFNNGDPGKGTFGLSVPVVQAANGASQQSAAQQLLIGLRDDDVAYTNIGLVNLISSDWSHAHLAFFDAAGGTLGLLNVEVPPYGVAQLNKPLTGPDGLGLPPRALYRVQVTVDAGGSVYPYATVINLKSTDPFVVTPAGQLSEVYRVPGVVRAPGLNGTVWRSGFFLTNPSSSARKVSVLYSYVPCDVNGCAGRQISSGPGDVSMAPGETKAWDDFPAAWLVGNVPDSVSYGSSYIDVAPAPGDANRDPLLVLGVTFNSQPTGPVGLQLSGFTDLDGGSKTGAGKRLLLTGLASNNDFRTNVAFFLTSGTLGSFNVRVLSETGVTLRTFGWNLTGSSPFKQFSDSDLFGGVDKSNRMSIVVDSFDGSPVAAYATIIDNTSGDATFVKAQPAP